MSHSFSYVRFQSERDQTVRRNFTSPFVLDRAKLSRMLDILEKRFSEESLEFKPQYEVTFGNGKNLRLTNLEELLSLDNPVKNPINSLTIKSGAASMEQSPDPNVSGPAQKSLDFELEYENASRRNISLVVSAIDSKVANQLFAEVEEQVERTLTSSVGYKLRTFMPLLFGLLIALAFLFFLFSLPVE